MDAALIDRIVAEVVRRLRALGAGTVPAEVDPPVRLVTEERVLEAAARGGAEIRVLKGAIVTPLARDALRHSGISLVEASGADADRAPEAGGKSDAIAIGADHRGYPLKESLKAAFLASGREVVDCGAFSAQASAYPEVAEKVATAVAAGRCGTGIMVDGGGAPSAIAANKVAGIRAAACHDVTCAKYARAHVDANLLCLGVGAVGDTVAREIVATWLTTPFEGGEHAAWVRNIGEIEQRQRR